MTKFNFDRELHDVYEARIAAIRAAAETGDAESCLTRASSLLGFMNRFRNCDLEWYFDEELHEILLSLNPARFDTQTLLKEKNRFRIAFVFNRFNDTGGAAFTHRYLLERYVGDDCEFEQFVLITNDANEADYRHRERYAYMRDNIELSDFKFLEPDNSTVRKAEKTQQWLFDNQIDFAIVQPSPLTMYAMSSQPVPIWGSFSADCHVFTLGPGTGDFTFYVENDQVFKYRYADPNMDERRTSNILLPLPPIEYIESAEPLSRSELGVPDDAIVSASTNIWKSAFGDAETLFEGLAILLRRHENYHHLFLGTPRSADSLEYFLNRNSDLKGRLKYVGAFPYIYRVLKSLDFYVNSFPVSGATNTEIAALGKPSIDLFSHRDLSFHNTEFLRSNECSVSSLSEFVQLGERLITDTAYRTDLGGWLRGKVLRDLDKGWIARQRLYDAFVTEFRQRVSGRPRMPALGVDHTIEYERRIAFFSAHVRNNWPDEARWNFLAECRNFEPARPFGWIAGIEETIRTSRSDRFEVLETELSDDLLNDTRIQVMRAIAHDSFGEVDTALKLAIKAADMAVYDTIAPRFAARILARSGQIADAEIYAARATTEPTTGKSPLDHLSAMPPDDMPLYYNF